MEVKVARVLLIEQGTVGRRLGMRANDVAARPLHRLLVASNPESTRSVAMFHLDGRTTFRANWSGRLVNQAWTAAVHIPASRS
jgi:hypothetical protein